MSRKPKLFLDFDGTIVNTIRAIVSLYNEDFVAYKKYEYINWFDINTWDFTELSATTPEYVNHYFNQPRFFKHLDFMDNFEEIYVKLKDKYDITIVSSGYSPNLKLKELWIDEHLPGCKFIGVNLKDHKDKAHINMTTDGIFIDDSTHNLITSNAKINICFGEEYEWNSNWNGIRCKNWYEVWRYLNDLPI